jgi:hypothetical protein
MHRELIASPPLAHSPRKLRLLSLLLALAPTSALAVRPFVTDDARIVDEGQVTSEVWLETVYIEGPPWEDSVHALVGTSVNQWLELTAVSTFGIETGFGNDIANPVFQAKTLLFPAMADGPVGIAVSTGYIPELGMGPSHAAGDGFYALTLITKRMYEDRLLLHTNLGVTGTRTETAGERLRPYAGVGTEFALWDFKWRGVAEVFTGDPFDPLRSDVSSQWGLRWLHSDLFNFDLIAGWEPEVDDRLERTGRHAYWLQLGVRITFDAYTPGGRRGRVTGGDGLFQWR